MLTGNTEGDSSLSTPLFGLFMFFRGLGNILSTPIATALVHDKNESLEKYRSANSGFEVADGRYKLLILYVGISFSAAAAVAVFGWSMEGRARSRR